MPQRPSGLNLSWIDSNLRPQDDLFGYMNGTWLRDVDIPSDRSSHGSFQELFDRAERDVHEIVNEVTMRWTEEEPQNPDGDRIATMFSAFMDEQTLNERGCGPIVPMVHAINDAHDHADLARLLASPSYRTQLIAPYVWIDQDDSSRYQVMLNQSGLGLPNEAYYRQDTYAPARAAYLAYLADLARLAGLGDPGDADKMASDVLALETSIAALHWDAVTSRDVDKTRNPTTRSELATLAPEFPWDAFIEGTGADPAVFARVNVKQPSYVAGVAKLYSATPLPLWRLWAALHVIDDYAPYLSSDFAEAHFAFHGTALAGTQTMRERWKRGISLVEETFGDALGRIYVKRYFPPTHKQRMDELVARIIEAYRESISSLDWMSDATREKALAKLDKFTPKIGYPVRWRDYSALTLIPGDLVGSLQACLAFEAQYQWTKALGPVDRDEWLMTPQTVNAYYNASANEIVFPAAILQPPFFDANADDAVNFGGIGAVIAHEIGHGFDDQGSKYDGDGNLISWWTDDDRTNFEARAAQLIDIFDGLVPRDLSGEHTVNGALTIGENIGDLGGLSIAVRAYLSTLSDRTEPVIDGYTPLQRVFLGWAQVWRGKNRDENAIQRLAMDPHSPNEFRCNTTASLVPEFYEAFDVREGDDLFRPVNERVRIW
ncbi:M13 family metallopeptidase [Devriesea agamarum]|uniref:M13 family metallopeptidase n=1 Tax=Devriesea agamarum TaxID=472569 RepID=UPI00071E508A|nr:M13-type metalloendopeptidase [Devriesea agamarum]